MESLFNRRFDDVRSHTGMRAKSACDALGALAYTQGDRIAFPAPQPPKSLVAHELAHVVQQARGVSLPGGISRPGDRYEREAKSAERAADNGSPVGGNLTGAENTPASDAAVLEKRVAGDIRLADYVQRYASEALQMDDGGAKGEPVKTGDEGAPGVKATAPPTTAFSYAAGLKTFQGNIRVYDSDLIFDDDWGTANYLIRLGKVTWKQHGSVRGIWVVDQAEAVPYGVMTGFKFGPKIEVRNRIINERLEIFLEVSLQIAGPRVKETFSLTGTAKQTSSESIKLGVEQAEASASSGTTIGVSFTVGREVDLPGAELMMRRGLKIENYSAAKFFGRDVPSFAFLGRDTSIDSGPPSSLDVQGISQGLFEGNADIKSELTGTLWRSTAIA